VIQSKAVINEFPDSEWMKYSITGINTEKA